MGCGSSTVAPPTVECMVEVDAVKKKKVCNTVIEAAAVKASAEPEEAVAKAAVATVQKKAAGKEATVEVATAEAAAAEAQAETAEATKTDEAATEAVAAEAAAATEVRADQEDSGPLSEESEEATIKRRAAKRQYQPTYVAVLPSEEEVEELDGIPFRIGDAISDDVGHTGVLRYVGRPEGLRVGEFCGIELDRPSEGLGDGEMQDVRCFQAVHGDTALFVRRHQLRPPASRNPDALLDSFAANPGALKALLVMQTLARGFHAKRRARSIKRQLTAHGERFAAVDKRAMLAPDEHAETVEALAKYLSEGLQSDIEKARAAFFWVASHIKYDFKMLRSGKLRDQDSESVLKKRWAVCSGYASVFYDVVEAMGLEVATRRGWSKGYGLEPGKEPTGAGHAWNAVKLEGEWGLVDTCWGAGYVADGHFVHELKERWFLTPPELFLEMHFDEDHPDNQLVARPVSLLEWTNLPLTFELLKHDMELLSHTKVLIEVTEKRLEVQIKNPRELDLQGDIELKKDSKKFPTATATTAGGITIITASLPVKGMYQLDCDICEEVPGGTMIKTVMTYCIRRA